MVAVGDSVASYRITGIIGRGAMATVYRAHDDRLNRDVALKILDPGYSQDFIYRARFEREYRVTALLKNDHIVPIYDGGRWGDQLYIAMMLVDGPNLGEILKEEGPLDLQRVVALVRQLADGLDEAHAQRIIHRDVKPANVLVVRHGATGAEHAYLADFGLTLGMEGTHLTRSGGFMGTLAYTAPEQLNSAPIDGRADEYALAATTFQMLTGEMPFRRDNEMALVNAQLFDAPPNVTDLQPDLPPRLDAVIARGMAKKPEDRYATAGDFAKALAATSAHAAAPVAVRASGRIGKVAVALGLIAAAVLGAALTYAALTFVSGPPAATRSPLSTIPAVIGASPTPAVASVSPSTSTSPSIGPPPTPGRTPKTTPKGPPPTLPPTPTPTPTSTSTLTPTPPGTLPLVHEGSWTVDNFPNGVSGDPYVVVGQHQRRYVISTLCASQTDCRLAVNTFDTATGKRLGSIAFKWNGSEYTYRGGADWYDKAGGETCQAATGDLIENAYTTREEVHISPKTTRDGVILEMIGTKTISGEPTAAGVASACAPFAMTFVVGMSWNGEHVN